MIIPLENYEHGRVRYLKVSRSKRVEVKSNYPLAELAKMNTRPPDMVTKTTKTDAWCLIIQRTENFDRSEWKKIGVCVFEDHLTDAWETTEIFLI